MRKKGRHRDQLIVQLINEGRCWTAEQIRRVVFADVKHPQKCQERLLKLVRQGLVKRHREFVGEPYTYYAEANQKCPHYLALNWVRVALHPVHVWQYEYVCDWGTGKLVADALAILRKEKVQPLFIELDRNKNGFHKVQKYTDYYLSRAWVEKWWAVASREGDTYRFPQVWIVTTRPDVVRRKVREENQEGLRFRVMSLEEVKEGLRVCQNQ